MNAFDNTNENYVFGLWINPVAVVGIVGFIDNDKFVIKDTETVNHNLGAVSEWGPHDIEKISDTVSYVKKCFEKRSGFVLKDACTAVSGKEIKTENVHSCLNFEEETVIKDEHIYSLLQKGVEEAYKKYRNFYGTSTKFYCINKSNVKFYLNDVFTENPVIDKGHKLSIDMYVSYVPHDVVDSLKTVVEKAGLNLITLTIEPSSYVEAALDDKDRLKNIALVDVSEGSVLVLKDGTLSAYGNISFTGDSPAEVIANYCLVESDEAESIIKNAEFSNELEYEDILGLSHSISKKEVFDILETPVKNMCKTLSEEIIKLNGGENVSEIFVIGAGSEDEGFMDSLSADTKTKVTYLSLNNLESADRISLNGISLNSDIFTAVGICLNSFDSINSFINVSLNDENVLLFNNGRLTVVDAVMQIGLDKSALFPKRGDSLVFKINGEEKNINGDFGESCAVTLNYEPANLNSVLNAEDKIKLVPSFKGDKGCITLGDIKKNNPKINIIVNKMKVALPCICTVNDGICPNSYVIKTGDDIEFKDYLTVAQILELLDIHLKEDEYVTVNNIKADKETKVFEGLSLDIVK